MTAGRLVLCPTPLGNLDDITARALRALRECDFVVAEDTRVTGALLRHFSIDKPLRSFHERVRAAREREIRAALAAGKTVVLTSDAGMPGISDPGSELVRLARAAGAAVDALPGPSAFVGALVLSGFDISRFRFEGFPPRKRGERKAYLRALRAERAAIVWYEAPTRVVGLLEDVERELPGRQVFALREYTKMFEQHALGTASEVSVQIARPPRGEFTIVLEGASSTVDAAAQREVSAGARAALAELLAHGVSARDAASAIAIASGAPKNALYRLAIDSAKKR
ncbi:MAG: 16S rRNA (cytidine(1402)-2'-O)-methyltransferase [Candidatus Eremiobacteraeota bacterium]|nr:16S rRNA (cytidine(1402)-2'-O)-methyltransferase [Candidatus Eremiobacteraeota bacterium]